MKKNNKSLGVEWTAQTPENGALQNAIFNSANFSSIATDANGVIQIFNVGAENMLGYKAEEVMNKITPAELSDPQELVVRAKALSEELETPIAPGFEALVFKASRGIEDIYELTCIRKDGSHFPAIVSVTALRDAQESIIGYLLIGTDNTARKQAEEALSKAGALQNAIFNSANFSSIATDANGVIQIFNVGAENMLGYKADEVMNKITPADISDPQEVIVRAKALTEELGTPIAPGFEALVFKASRGIEDIYDLTYIRKDGSHFPAIVSVTALRDAQELIIGYLLIGTDNTARKQAEEALSKAAALQNAIFNSANFSSIATDANGVIQIFNVGAENMLGYKAEEVMNKITPADISDPQEVIARAKALTEELDTPIAPGFEALVFKASRGIEDIYELTYIRKDGSRFPAIVSVTALRDDQELIIGYLLIGTDNTARKQAEEALSKAGALQNAIFNSANFSSIATDANGVIQIFNVGAENMLGYKADEVMNKITPAELSDPQELVVRAKALSEELETPIAPGFEALVFKASRGIEDIYELTCIRKDGSHFPAIVSVTALRDDQELIIGYLLIGTDNTARKQAEEALSKAGALQKAIFNSANFSSIATDANGVIQIFNVGAENMLGYKAEEVMNKITPADISDPQEVIARAKALTEELDTPIAPGFDALVFKASRGIEDIYELTYIRKDGSRFPAIVSVTALRDDQELIIGYLLIGTDNTARKQAEEALSKAGALQNAIFNSANFSSIATDANGVIQIFNVGAENMLGYKADEVMNKITPADISDPQEVIARAKALTEELETPIAPGFDALVFKASRGIEDIYELTYIRKDGSRFPAIVSVTALRDAQESIIGYLLIGTDNTARKQADEVIKKLTLATVMQAEGLAKSKAQFLANMSHEIRTPMNGIIGFSELALLREMPFDIRDYLTKINTSSIGLLGILNDILDLSKLDAGGVSLSLGLFAVDELRNMLNTLFIDSAEKKGLKFSIDIAPDMPCNMIGDELRLQQVLVNLLGNAVKFTASGSVSLNISLLDSDSLQARILCCVKDTGIGMSSKEQGKLFQPFSQADDSITRRFGGTGLGLALSHNLVKLMGGNLIVESMPEVGSSFSFELVFGLSSESFREKIKQPSGTLSSALQEFGRQLVGIRILVAEDNLFNQQIIREFLVLSGISVEIANNGKEALTFLEQSEFDAVLMDIHMPIMDGFAATREIRNQPCFANLPVIALTAGVTEEERGQCLEAGMNDFISKPINPSLLLSTLVQWVNPSAVTITAIDTAKSPIKEYADDLLMSDCIDNVLNIQSLSVNTADINNLLKPVLDREMCVLKELVGDDPETISEFLNYFTIIAIEISAEIIAAINNGDIIAAGNAAHKLKASALSVGAISFGELCAQLESAGKSGNEIMLKGLLADFEGEWSVLQKYLLAWPDEPTQELI